MFDIDWQGTQQLKEIKNLSLVTFFILPPNIEVLRNRLLKRHEGQTKLIEERMHKFSEEVSHWKEYNHVVVNDDDVLKGLQSLLIEGQRIKKYGFNHTELEREKTNFLRTNQKALFTKIQGVHLPSASISPLAVLNGSLQGNLRLMRLTCGQF